MEDHFENLDLLYQKGLALAKFERKNEAFDYFSKAIKLAENQSFLLKNPKKPKN